MAAAGRRPGGCRGDQRQPPAADGAVWRRGVRPADNARMTDATGIARQLQRDGCAIIPGLLSQQALTAARAELGPLLDVAEWGSGFDGGRTKRAWAPLAVTRCLDQAALAPLVLDTVAQVIGPGTQFGITCAIQVHPRQ